jgi:hypothetical protein
MSGTPAASGLEILREAMTALARADAPRLEQLATEAGMAVVPREERKASRGEQYASLGLLLALTHRNLRLLRGERSETYTRG